MIENLRRFTKFALEDLYRNKGISIAAIFILIVTIVLFTSLYFLQGIGHEIISQIQNKIDITAYFKDGTAEQDILDVRGQLLKNVSDVKSVEYVSKEDALRAFTQRHQDNQVFSNALEQVGDNPFLPSLNITTGSTAQYEAINNVLQSDNFSNLIEKVDYSQKKVTIDQIFSLISKINKTALVVAAVLVLLAILIVFNTIKLAIDSSKDEISTMRIVGASSWFVRAPFIIEGALFGLISFVFCFVVTGIFSYFLSPGLVNMLSGFSIWNYFVSHMLWIILIQLGCGIILGSGTSFVVVQRYLKI